MPRFYSFHDMPFARGIYCYAPCMATTRERKVPILGLEIEPSSVSACPALTPRPVPAEGARRRPPVCPRLGSACTRGGRQPSPALPPHPAPHSMAAGAACSRVSRAGNVLSHQRTPAAAQPNRDLDSALYCSSALCGKDQWSPRHHGTRQE